MSDPFGEHQHKPDDGPGNDSMALERLCEWLGIDTGYYDIWGTRHAGTNYGLLFTAWGFAGILGPTIGGVLFDRYKNYGAAFYAGAALALVAMLCVSAAKRPDPRPI